uniref:Uncharacterized protein n=1 Tax=Escherichia coli TaxID=562 RepID=A0A2L1KK54_ECOLX|nr:hypothetical protein [Escherichia coli]
MCTPDSPGSGSDDCVASTLRPSCIIEIAVNEPRQPGGCKLKTAPVRPVVAARPAEYVCSEDLFY